MQALPVAAHIDQNPGVYDGSVLRYVQLGIVVGSILNPHRVVRALLAWDIIWTRARNSMLKVSWSPR